MGIIRSLLEAKEEKGRKVHDRSPSSGADWRQPDPNSRWKIDPEAMLRLHLTPGRQREPENSTNRQFFLMQQYLARTTIPGQE
jgi:hypothetical protein